MSYRHNGGPAIEVPEGYDRIGWVIIHRSIRDHWLVGFGKPVAPADPERGAHSHYEAFSDLIMECRYDHGMVLNNGKRMALVPGQLLGGVSWLANRWNWKPKKVRWFLDKLEEDQMICRNRANETGDTSENFKGNRHGNQRQVITVCNYMDYQLRQKHEGTPEGNRGAVARSVERATTGAINVDTQGVDSVDKNETSPTDDDNQRGNQKGSHKGRDLKEKVKESHTDARAHTRTREAPCLEDQKPKTQIIEDGWFYGEAIELDPEEHADWRAKFSALEGTWPAPLMSADHFLAVEFDRQGVKDPRSRKVRVMAYLAKRNTEAAMLQAQVTATAIVKPTPRTSMSGGSYNSRPKTDWDAVLDSTTGGRK